MHLWSVFVIFIDEQEKHVQLVLRRDDIMVN
jgi:hypothetical protein